MPHQFIHTVMVLHVTIEKLHYQSCNSLFKMKTKPLYESTFNSDTTRLMTDLKAGLELIIFPN